MDKIKIGFIGTGTISNFHARGYNKLDNVEIYAACDLNRERAEDFAQKYGAKHVFTDYNEMLKLSEIDAISICTWNNAHAPATIAALKAGKHVLCEKPPAMNTAEAKEMARVAEETGKLLMIGFVRRFGKNTQVLKNFIDNGYFGDIYYANTKCIRRYGNPGGWFANSKRSGGGPLIDLGVHMIDLVKFLMGKPKAITVTGSVYNKIGARPYLKGTDKYISADSNDSYSDVEDFTAAMIKFENGATLTVETSFDHHIKEEQLTLEIYGSKAGAIMEPKLEIFTEVNGYLTDMTPKYACSSEAFSENFENETRHFIDCIVNGTECLNTPDDGVEIMKIIDAIYESARTGYEVIIK